MSYSDSKFVYFPFSSFILILFILTMQDCFHTYLTILSSWVIGPFIII